MSFNRFQQSDLTQILLGTITVAAIVISQQQIVVAKSAQEVAEIAALITVQINSTLGDGSGVIIAKAGQKYTVLTVNHVVEDASTDYSIRTHDGENHLVKQVIRLQTDNTEPDLAIVEFESNSDYTVAMLGDSEQAVIGAQIYVYGYPATGGLTGAEREPELSPGLVTSRPKSRPEGYNLRYQAVTWSGMSGGPVFDAAGRVVGLHGQGEFGFAQTSSGDVAPIKTGFNAAIPINLFIRQLSETQLKLEDIQIDDTPTTATDSTLSLDNPTDAKTFFFRGLTFLDQGYAWEAIEDFNQALKHDPNLPEAYFNLGLARTVLAANFTSEVGTVRGSNPIPDYTEAIRLNPGYADAYYNRGLAYLELKKLDLAIADFKQAAQLYRQLGREASYRDAVNRIQELETSM
ncbi:trypsin-like peptidase domain-containing protein [Limnoraphis robusta Tam1]|uniref:trypsin-like peptidase domain-containing protein n=1 Tax=Limnoraphis robusta TaxID=1118279 RepID=UPI002B21F544|nr:trypsin-like peptidase domain-containing protein [Limnoraphis robusta]MEA5538336.1 trypsin-like peptidase domain-containing protein [Limnoraphis robusta Tam1]